MGTQWRHGLLPFQRLYLAARALSVTDRRALASINAGRRPSLSAAREENLLTRQSHLNIRGAGFTQIFFEGAVAVVKPEWGTKHSCQNCGAKFYDLQAETPVCPGCETPVPKTTVRSGRPKAAAKPVEKEPAKKVLDDDGDLEIADDGAIATIEGVDDDDDDMEDDDLSDDTLLVDDEGT
jgi:hypothetical protein